MHSFLSNDKSDLLTDSRTAIVSFPVKGGDPLSRMYLEQASLLLGGLGNRLKTVPATIRLVKAAAFASALESPYQFVQ